MTLIDYNLKQCGKDNIFIYICSLKPFLCRNEHAGREKIAAHFQRDYRC